MPLPSDYWTASRDFDAFLDDVIRTALLQTHNQAWAMARAVLHVFRSHLPPQDALVFADALPPVLRALFVADWDLSVPVLPMPPRADLVREVRTVRESHNTFPETAIDDVAAALFRTPQAPAIRAALHRLGPDAEAYWLASG